MATEDAERARFEALVRDQLLEPLRRFLARRTDPATADDVLSETLLVCWRRRDEVPTPALPWAYGVARHCLGNADRAARRQRVLAGRIGAVDRPRDVPGPGESGERDGALHDALLRLRGEDAELLRLWAWEQLGPGEIATVLGVSPNAISIRLHRARSALREELGKIEKVAGHEESGGAR